MPGDLLQVTFQGGPNESLDPRHLPLGSVISATNQVYDSDGQYQTRYGVTALASGLTSCLKLAGLNSELLAIDGTALWSLTPTASSWTQRDLVPAMGLTHRPLHNTTQGFQSFGEVCVSGYRVVGYVDTVDNFPRAIVYDQVTGAIVLGPTYLSVADTLANVFIGAVGTTVILAASGAAGIYFWSLQTSPLGAWSVSFQLSAGDYQNNNVYAVAYLSDRFVLSYEKFTGSLPGTITYSLRLRSFTSAFALIADTTTTIGTHTGGGAPSWSGYGVVTCLVSQGTLGETLWVGAHTVQGKNNTGTNYCWTMAFNPTTLASLHAPVELDATALSTNNWHPTSMTLARIGATTVLFTSSGFSSGAPNIPATFMQQNTTSVAASTAIAWAWAGIASAPVFVASLGTHLAVSYFAQSVPITLSGAGGSYTTEQGSFYLVDLRTNISWTNPPVPRLLKTFGPRIGNLQPLAYAGTWAQQNAPLIVSATSTTLETVVPMLRGTDERVGLDLVTVDMGKPAYLWSPAVLGRELYLSGDYYDGNRDVEIGCPFYPTIVDVDTYTPGTEQRQYVATFARVNAQGNLEESAPSVPVTISATSAGARVSVSCLTLTRKDRYPDDYVVDPGPADRVYVLLYRTADLSTGDTLRFLVNAQPFQPGSRSSVAGPAVTITDSTSDTDLTDGTHGILYTDSGELAHNCPPSFTHAATHKNRLWGIGPDQRTVWYSQTYLDGEMPNWNENQSLTVDEAGEPLVALASLYDRIAIFTANRIYVVYGDGPSLSGAGNDLTQAQRVPSPSGCIDPRSVLNTPLGVVFQSSRGIEVLRPDSSVEFFGLPVSVTTKGAVCTSVAHDVASSTIRWTMTQPSGTGVVVRYDLRRERWSVHSITQGGTIGNFPGAALTASYVHPIYGWVGAHQNVNDGNVAMIYRENTTSDAAPWLDFGTYFVPLTVTLAWAKPNDLQGWGHIRRIRVLATYYDAHGLSAKFGYDYVAGTEVHAFSSNVVAGFVSGGVEQVKYAPVQAKCEAIQVTLTTVAPTTPQVVGTGRACGLDGIAFELTAKRGGFRRTSGAQES